jgi:hypothetical protein
MEVQQFLELNELALESHVWENYGPALARELEG